MQFVHVPRNVATDGIGRGMRSYLYVNVDTYTSEKRELMEAGR